MDSFNFDSFTVGGNGVASFGSDNALHFVWKMDVMELTAETEIKGRKIYADVEMCEIHSPGLKNVLFKKFYPAKKTYKAELETFLRMHPKARQLYKEWKEGCATPTVGTPVTEWAALSESERAELRAMNLFTIEQIAEASDITCQAMGAKGREWRTKAQAFIATSTETAAAQRFAAENERLRADLDSLREQVNTLRVAELDAPKKRGRPRKDSVENVETTTFTESDE
jgi:hypothetical protein